MSVFDIWEVTAGLVYSKNTVTVLAYLARLPEMKYGFCFDERGLQRIKTNYVDYRVKT